MFDVDLLKEECRGRWPETISTITGIPLEVLDEKNHPCPKCGGTDRFRLIDAEAGALFCNKCFNKGNGDGISAIMWYLETDFKAVVSNLAHHLGYGAGEVQSNVVAEMAWRKRCGLDALKDFGATEAERNGQPVCRVPMWDADMQKTGDFDLAPGELDKGKMTSGSKHGMFVARKPEPGETVVVVEGVKDAAAIRRELGLLSIGLPTCRMDASFARLFRDCNVVIVPDRDKAGTEGGNETAGRLYGVAASVAIAELPAEYKETGGADVRDVFAMRDGAMKVQSAIEHARPWIPGPARAQKIHVLSEVVDELLDQEDQTGKLLRVGLPGLDRTLGGGVLPTEMVIIAGRPSHGKSVAGMQAIDSLSRAVPCLVLSEEMASEQLARRAICGLTTAAEKDWPANRKFIKSTAAQHFSQRRPVYVVESSGTAQRAIEIIEHCVKAHEIGAVMVDYVQLLRGNGNGRYEQVSDVSTRLKQTAMQHGLVLLAICQLNRSIETRGNARETTSPRMGDLRDSGQLEQDADVIVFVEWLWRTSPAAHGKEEYRMTIGKNKNRSIVGNGFINCLFKSERQRLFAPANESAEREAAFDGVGG